MIDVDDLIAGLDKIDSSSIAELKAELQNEKRQATALDENKLIEAATAALHSMRGLSLADKRKAIRRMTKMLGSSDRKEE